MADYQEYRRRILHRRWRRMFITAALLILLVLLAAVGVLWKRLHREPAPNTAQGPTILQQELTGSEWNTISYTPARRLSVQTLDNGMTAMDFRLAAQPASPAVERSSFSDVSFLGDSLTQGMQLYEEGMQNAMFCAYKGVGPNVIVNGTTCKRADGVAEIPMDVLAAQQPRALYILLGTNALATSAMLRAGASAGATGENAVIVNAARARILAGPIGLVMANSMLGECSPAMARAVAESPAHKVLIPVAKCGAHIAGLPEKPLAQYIADAAELIRGLL